MCIFKMTKTEVSSIKFFVMKSLLATELDERLQIKEMLMKSAPSFSTVAIRTKEFLSDGKRTRNDPLSSRTNSAATPDIEQQINHMISQID